MLKLSLLACCALLAFMLMNPQSGPFVHLIVAPALGVLGALLLILLGTGSLLRSRKVGAAHPHERSDA